MLQPLTPQEIVNDSRQKVEVHREDESERLASRETPPSVSQMIRGGPIFSVSCG